jgi:hypothetical protein
VEAPAPGFHGSGLTSCQGGRGTVLFQVIEALLVWDIRPIKRLEQRSVAFPGKYELLLGVCRFIVAIRHGSQDALHFNRVARHSERFTKCLSIAPARRQRRLRIVPVVRAGIIFVEQRPIAIEGVGQDVVVVIHHGQGPDNSASVRAVALPHARQPGFVCQTAPRI